MAIMAAGVKIEHVWSDDDLIEFKIQSSDGSSIFVNTVYVSHVAHLEHLDSLGEFKSQIYGGIYDLCFGEFGPEFANGAFKARLHFQTSGKIHLTINVQTEFNVFGKQSVASDATLYTITEPALLDRFIEEFRIIGENIGNEALLEIV